MAVSKLSQPDGERNSPQTTDPRLSREPERNGAPEATSMTSIERFHLFDDEPEYPNQIFARLSFEEAIDEADAKKAWSLAIDAHPFAHLEAAKTPKGWQWIPASPGTKTTPAPASHFDFSHVDQDDPWCVRQALCDVGTNSYLGIRVFDSPKKIASTIEPNQDGSPIDTTVAAEAWFCVHHAVADGIACLKVINDWLMIYNNLRSGLPPLKGTHPVDPKLLTRRARLGLLRWGYLKFLPLQCIALFGAAKFLFRKTASLNQPLAAPKNPPSFPAIVGHWIDEQTTEKIYQHAKTQQISTNAILLGQWFRCLAVWRQTRSITQGDLDRSKRPPKTEWIRVILPMSIRTHADRRLPVANRTSIVQIDRRGNETQDEVGQFHQMLNREIAIIRGWQLEKMFLIFIRLFALSNGILKRVASNPTSRGLAVFTDLGRPFAFSLRRLNRLPSDNPISPIKPIDFDLAGPIRRGTPLNVSVSRYQGRLKISLHYDASQLNRKEADTILQGYAKSLIDLECPVENHSQ